MSVRHERSHPVDRRVRVQGRPVDSYPALPREAERGSVRRITVVGEEILSRPCHDVTRFGSPGLSRLIDDMFLTMYVADGAGLAANQVGVDLRLFVYDCPDDHGARHVGHIVNPVLDLPDPGGRRLVDDFEGCLSVPGAAMAVPRTDRTVARGQDKDGNPSSSRERGTSRGACSTRPTTSSATRMSTGSPAGTARTPCGRWRTEAKMSSPAARSRPPAWAAVDTALATPPWPLHGRGRTTPRGPTSVEARVEVQEFVVRAVARACRLDDAVSEQHRTGAEIVQLSWPGPTRYRTRPPNHRRYLSIRRWKARAAALGVRSLGVARDMGQSRSAPVTGSRTRSSSGSAVPRGSRATPKP